jgi:hypothetical protein
MSELTAGSYLRRLVDEHGLITKAARGRYVPLSQVSETVEHADQNA